MPNTYEAIQTYTLASTSASVTFNSLGNYTDLKLVCSVQLGSASGSKLRFNGDTASNYGVTYFLGRSPTVTNEGNQTTALFNNFVYGDATATNTFTLYTIDIASYANSRYKMVSWEYGTGTDLQGSNGETGLITGVWKSTAPITSIEISPWNPTTYQVGSVFTLFGIKGA